MGHGCFPGVITESFRNGWLPRNCRDTMSPVGICVTPWDTENITTDSTVSFRVFIRQKYLHVNLSRNKFDGNWGTFFCMQLILACFSNHLFTHFFLFSFGGWGQGGKVHWLLTDTTQSCIHQIICFIFYSCYPESSPQVNTISIKMGSLLLCNFISPSQFGIPFVHWTHGTFTFITTLINSQYGNSLQTFKVKFPSLEQPSSNVLSTNTPFTLLKPQSLSSWVRIQLIRLVVTMLWYAPPCRACDLRILMVAV